MSHVVYQTQGIILAKRNMQESNILFTIYTERFGLIYVNAQSIRKQSSKLRFNMNLFSLVVLDIVSGKNIWKLVGAHSLVSSFNFSSELHFPILSRVAGLIIRLVQGEESQEHVWKDIVLLHQRLISTETESRILDIELIFLSRLLFHLGYWDAEIFYLKLTDPFVESCYDYARTQRRFLIQEINKRIQETQL